MRRVVYGFGVAVGGDFDGVVGVADGFFGEGECVGAQVWYARCVDVV